MLQEQGITVPGGFKIIKSWQKQAIWFLLERAKREVITGTLPARGDGCSGAGLDEPADNAPAALRAVGQPQRRRLLLPSHKGSCARRAVLARLKGRKRAKSSTPAARGPTLQQLPLLGTASFQTPQEHFRSLVATDAGAEPGRAAPGLSLPPCRWCSWLNVSPKTRGAARPAQDLPQPPR